MSNDTYVIDELATGVPLVTITDDGSGNDWLIIEGSYKGYSTINLSWVVSSSGQATSASGMFFDETGSHRLTVDGQIENVSGSNGRDIITGNELDNLIFGDSDYGNPSNTTGGNDKIAGGDGDDIIFGGHGDDLIYGGGDDDILFGDEGNNVLDGGEGSDILKDGNGIGVLWGGKGNDLLLGGGGDDSVLDYYGNNALFGGAGNDFLDTSGKDEDKNILVGGAGDDSMNNGSGIGYLFGGDGSDSLFGGAGNDVLYGGHGKDTLSGGAGRDSLYGGGGSDVFDFSSWFDSTPESSGIDVIADFSRTEGDQISMVWFFDYTEENGWRDLVFIGYKNFTGQKGEVRAKELDDGSGSIVYADIDGDRAADFAVVVKTSTKLIASDFIFEPYIVFESDFIL
jgi:Ca2+-binding RTX toxin-like protein